MAGAQGQRPKPAPKNSAMNVAPGARGLSKQSPPPKGGSAGTQRSSAAMTNIRRYKENSMPGNAQDCCG